MFGRKSLVLLLFPFVFAACNRTTYDILEIQALNADGDPGEDMLFQTCSFDAYDIELAFVEDALEFLVFNLAIKNHSSQPIIVDFTNFDIEYIEDIDLDDETRTYALNVQERLRYLDQEAEILKKTKKNRTIGNAILAGLEALSIAVSPGGNLGVALVYGAESSLYIAEDRNAMRVAELSIEDEKEYLKKWVLLEETVLPGEQFSKDLLFERSLRDSEFYITASLAGESCEFTYVQSVLSR